MAKKYQICYLKPSELKPYFNNPRNNDQAIIKVAESIQAFGFQSPVIADKKKVIIAGHTRWKAALKLNLKEIPVIITDLPPEKAKAYRLADNKTSEFAEWDWEKLQIELSQLCELELDFDLNAIGFTEDEINNLFDNGFEDVEEIEPNLPEGDKEPVVNITFTVSEKEFTTIQKAIKKALEKKPIDPMGINENKNGNALYYICNFFNKKGE